ncbi:MAG: hypothetical protein L0K07_01300 [Yaniella sp.]|uniref:hypothetical protein n=1 Tax=Yaniella sp. TaxID=2773929 RepID=UPI002649E62F|nr:hypothetical protein [Yaniella sp.]MDN5731034.1 hypothetical protein [Yaniella sp.]MDN5742296.1 hypothetical protein [Yaniella sp.]MDN6173522.1 hypothetical protein [Yaniella sp.]MDN6357604.1 hypothetical protein [Yaniella sp.]MDN6410023.1 hypothetical protein [Yaniella sp.]
MSREIRRYAQDFSKLMTASLTLQSSTTMLTYTAGNAAEDECVVLQNPQPLAQLYVG